MLNAHRFSLLLLVGFLGCASAPSSSSSVVNPPRSQVITQKEIDDYGPGGSVYDLVNKLRPNFLRSRGQTSLSGGTSPVAGELPGVGGEFYPNVFVDDITYGDISSLRGLQPNQVGEIRFYQAAEAERKFGPGNPGGVIAITNRR